jgi:hypothetical protein
VSGKSETETSALKVTDHLSAPQKFQSSFWQPCKGNSGGKVSKKGTQKMKGGRSETRKYKPWEICHYLPTNYIKSTDDIKSAGKEGDHDLSVFRRQKHSSSVHF